MPCTEMRFVVPIVLQINKDRLPGSVTLNHGLPVALRLTPVSQSDTSFADPPV